MNQYNFSAYFLVGQFDVPLLRSVIPVAQAAYNGITRRTGHQKFIDVNVNPEDRCLDITLFSDDTIDEKNFLRSAQYFSKKLKLQPGMSSYLKKEDRLLVQNLK